MVYPVETLARVEPCMLEVFDKKEIWIDEVSGFMI